MATRTDSKADFRSEEALERAADALLCALPRDPDCPAYTEKQLARSERPYCVVSTEALAEVLIAPHTLQSVRDELLFLAAISPLTRLERLCLRGWVWGWTQREICINPPFCHDVRAQQAVSRALRAALIKCTGSLGLTFAQFSRHTVYRRPARRRGR